MTNIEYLNTLPSKYFKFPIQYVEHKLTSDTVKDDLELINFKNKEDISNNSLYKYVLNPTNIFSNATANVWSNYYTTNLNFLKETQKIIKNFKQVDCDYEEAKFETVYDIYNNITNDNNFLEKYQYIDISYFKQFNNNSHILQTISLLNLTSPILSILIPLILLILPLFIFRLYGLNLNINTYLHLLKQVFGRHPLGNVFINFSSVSIDKKIYLIFSLAFYLFQMVQNAKSCYKFYNNLELMHQYLKEINTYVDYTITSFENFEKQVINYKNYELFISQMNEKKQILIKYKTTLENVTSYKFGITKALRIGEAMKCFYTLYDNEELKQSLQYSFGFNGYIHNLSSLNKKLVSKEISLCKYNKLKTKFKQAYYPIINNKPVKNSYDLNKKLLITGPNASGKTTILKTTLLNILFSQQIGMGFYSKAYIKPYTYLHCYLNIPDTSCRDSLFQAEARRCKNIITELETSLNDENHFCIFDELYSGTNPYEAISSSISLLRYITKYPKLDFVLTTHFLDVCKILDNDEKFMNCYMNIIEIEDDFEYTYKLINGISQVKGGVKVLKDLEYPVEIINNTKILLNSLKI